MTYHQQPKDFPSFDLVVATKGPKLKQATADSALLASPPRSYRPQAAADGFPDLPPGVRMGMLRDSGAIRARFRSYSLSEFAEWLRFRLATQTPGPVPNSGINAPARITNKTGLTGTYDFTLEYAGAFIAAERLSPDLRDRLDEKGPSIFTALEKQLGLKLEKTKTKAAVLVIDHIDRTPTDN
jgi:uncharacterized protein (TIGR03435 family)